MFICTGFPLSSFSGKTFRDDPNGLHRTSKTSGTVPAGNLTLQSALDGSDIAVRMGAITVLLLISSG